jgi:hypothetical protein
MRIAEMHDPDRVDAVFCLRGCECLKKLLQRRDIFNVGFVCGDSAVLPPTHHIDTEDTETAQRSRHEEKA